MNTIVRPKSLKEVAERSTSLTEFGLNLRDWLHELRKASSRILVMAAVEDEPPLLRNKFPQGNTADAWLAAYAEHLAQKIRHPAPSWAFSAERIAPNPVFDAAAEGPKLRILALVNAPAAFKRRNIYTPSVDLPLRLRAGRPAKPMEEKRKTNADRQRRFRKARQEELAMLRKMVARRAKRA